jgi:hypothetical protein
MNVLKFSQSGEETSNEIHDPAWLCRRAISCPPQRPGMVPGRADLSFSLQGALPSAAKKEPDSSFRRIPDQK